MPQEAILETFKTAMRHVSATVFAVTTRHEGEPFGILATAVSSLSFDPPSLLVCINQTSSLHAPLITADRFAVNVLGRINRDVANHFMTGSAGPDRFSVGMWDYADGIPVLANAQSSFLCDVMDRHSFGTHTIFVGALSGAHHRLDAKPLTYYDGRYIDISGAPDDNGA